MNSFTVVTDLVIDDLISLVLLLKLSNNSNNHIISTSGNISEKHAFQNAKELLSAFAFQWQLSHGSSIPLKNKFEHTWLSDFNGEDGLWGIHQFKESSRVAIDTVSQRLSHLISIASMTEVYKLFKKYKTTMNYPAASCEVSEMSFPRPAR